MRWMMHSRRRALTFMASHGPRWSPAVEPIVNCLIAQTDARAVVRKSSACDHYS
jgi:hypothetical protein